VVFCTRSITHTSQNPVGTHNPTYNTRPNFHTTHNRYNTAQSLTPDTSFRLPPPHTVRLSKHWSVQQVLSTTVPGKNLGWALELASELGWT
jgi:hypothetical protein